MAHKTCMQLVHESYGQATGKAFDETNHGKWSNATQHCAAWQCPRLVERAVKNMVVGLAQYADAYTKGDPDEHGLLGNDGYWHEHATAYAQACIALLTCDIGRLDGGTMDQLIRAIAKNANITLEE